jgi:heptosyltransferase-2
MLRRLAAGGARFVERRLKRLASPQSVTRVGEPLFSLFGLRPKGPAVNLAHVKSVLVVRVDEIGDLVLTSPFLRELRRNLPGAWITLVVKPSNRNLAMTCVYVDEVVTYDWEFDGRAGVHEMRLLARGMALASKHLWRHRFDLAIAPRWGPDDHNAGLIVYLSGAPRRLAYEGMACDVECGANGHSRLYTELLSDRGPRHEAERGLDIIESLGGTVGDERLEIWTRPDDEAYAEKLLADPGRSNGTPIVSFGIAARSPRRIWPVERFAALGRWLVEEYDARIILIGGEHHIALAEELTRRLEGKIINSVGQTTLRQAGALLRRCTLHVGNNSGPLHLAAAVGVPVVEISCHPLHGSDLHPTSPARFGPWSVPHTTVQPSAPLPPCRDGCDADRPHCILGIEVAHVREAVALRLSKTLAV